MPALPFPRPGSVVPSRRGPPAGRRAQAHPVRRRATNPASRAAVAAAVAAASPSTSTARMSTLSTCKLAISIYPPFSYDATGGGGEAVATMPASASLTLPPSVPPPPPSATALSFDPSAVTIPTLNWRTTRFLGLPLPPGLQIAVTPLRLSGWVDRASGQAALAFTADFQFTAFGGLYTPPIIPVETLLSTEGVRGEQLAGQGRRLEENGGSNTARLAGVARVPVLPDIFLSWFLRLPADCLAEMDARFEWDV